MKDAGEYLARLKALIIASSSITHWEIVREETHGDVGLFRYRVKLVDGSSLEMFEKFSLYQDRLEVSKYSFHWQDANGHLLMRWDNASHHPEFPTYPAHKHQGDGEEVHPHKPVTAEEILIVIADYYSPVT